MALIAAEKKQFVPASSVLKVASNVPPNDLGSTGMSMNRGCLRTLHVWCVV